MPTRTRLGLSLSAQVCPGWIAKIFGHLESADQAGREPRRRFALCGLQHGLHNLFAAMKVVDQQERHEGQENQ